MKIEKIRVIVGRSKDFDTLAPIVDKINELIAAFNESVTYLSDEFQILFKKILDLEDKLEDKKEKHLNFSEEDKVSQLLPCPFCFGEAEIITGSDEYFIACMNDSCFSSDCGKPFHNKEEAIAQWNKRA